MDREYDTVLENQKMNHSCISFRFYIVSLDFFLGGKISYWIGPDCDKSKTTTVGMGPPVFLLVSFCIACGCSCYEKYHTASPSNDLPSNLRTGRQHLDYLNLQTLMNNTSVRNAIDSTEQQLPEYHNLSTSGAMPTSTEVLSSNEPPAYKDITQQNSITITIEEESSAPPSYNDFIRQTCNRDETTQL